MSIHNLTLQYDLISSPLLSPVSTFNPDPMLMNNLNQPGPRRLPPGPRQTNNIPRGGFTPVAVRQLGFSMDTLSSPSHSHSSRSLAAQPPPVKHVSFRDDFPHNDWPEILPPYPRSGGPPPAPAPASAAPQGKWAPSLVPSPNVVAPGSRDNLSVQLDNSFENGDDGNSTTTSGSYTVDDISPRGGNIGYSVEQACV